MSDDRKQRTLLQNRSLHLFFRQMAKTLNDGGLDMKTVLEAKSVDVPWNEHTVKEVLWRPVYEIVSDKESTADACTTDYCATYEVLVRHFGENMGVTLPAWPDRFSQIPLPEDAK